MAIFQTYEMKGLQLSFANWISNISPTDTPFVSMTGKESVDQVKFQWQVDRLSKAAANAVAEGSDAVGGTLGPTEEMENYTQILRKAVRVTDSAKATGLYGRSNELKYQLEKVGAEIKRDLEHMFLTNGTGSISDKNGVRTTSGFRGLVGKQNTSNTKALFGSQPDVETNAVVVHETIGITVGTDDVFNTTFNLYMAGAKPDMIMVHPAMVHALSALMTATPRKKLFKNIDDKANLAIRSIKDPLGQEFEIVPNRFMPKQAMYFFNSKDWTQMVFRAPERTQLAKNGSNEKWMIEMEVGLRHRNPYASGILWVKPVAHPTSTGQVDLYNYDICEYFILAFNMKKSDGSTPATLEDMKAAIKTHFNLTASGTPEEVVEEPKTKTKARKATV